MNMKKGDLNLVSLRFDASDYSSMTANRSSLRFNGRSSVDPMRPRRTPSPASWRRSWVRIPSLGSGWGLPQKGCS